MIDKCQKEKKRSGGSNLNPDGKIDRMANKLGKGAVSHPVYGGGGSIRMEDRKAKRGTNGQDKNNSKKAQRAQSGVHRKPKGVASRINTG